MNNINWKVRLQNGNIARYMPRTLLIKLTTHIIRSAETEQ